MVSSNSEVTLASSGSATSSLDQRPQEGKTKPHPPSSKTKEKNGSSAGGGGGFKGPRSTTDSSLFQSSNSSRPNSSSIPKSMSTQNISESDEEDLESTPVINEGEEPPANLRKEKSAPTVPFGIVAKGNMGPVPKRKGSKGRPDQPADQ